MTQIPWRSRSRADKASWLGAAIAYPFIVVLPPVVAGGWLLGAVVSWTVLSVVIATFIGLFVGIFFDDSPAVRRHAAPDDNHTPWTKTVKVTAIASAVAALFAFLIAMLYEGFGAFRNAAMYGGTLAFASITAIIVPLVLRFGTVSRADIANKVAHRRARRNGRPRDLALLAGVSVSQRRQWFQSLRRRSLRVALLQSVVGLPLIVGAILAGSEELSGFPTVVRLVLTVVAAVSGVFRLVIAVRSMLRGTVLLVGRVTGGLYGVEVTGGQTPGLKELAWNVVTIGAAHEVTIDVRSASRIGKDGTLHPCPHLCGRQEIGGRRKLISRAIEGEHAVIVCAGNGPAIGLLGDLVRQ